MTPGRISTGRSASPGRAGDGPDRIEDPHGEGPAIWFQVIPERKSIKNRLHIDVNAGGGRTVPLTIRRERVEAEASRLVTPAPPGCARAARTALDHYAVAMSDPEGNEFDVF